MSGGEPASAALGAICRLAPPDRVPPTDRRPRFRRGCNIPPSAVLGFVATILRCGVGLDVAQRRPGECEKSVGCVYCASYGPHHPSHRREAPSSSAQLIASSSRLCPHPRPTSIFTSFLHRSRSTPVHQGARTAYPQMLEAARAPRRTLHLGESFLVHLSALRYSGYHLLNSATSSYCALRTEFPLSFVWYVFALSREPSHSAPHLALSPGAEPPPTPLRALAELSCAPLRPAEIRTPWPAATRTWRRAPRFGECVPISWSTQSYTTRFEGPRGLCFLLDGCPPISGGSSRMHPSFLFRALIAHEPGR